MCFMSHFSFRSILYLGAILYFVTPDLQREVNGFRGPTLIWSLCIRATFTSTISQLHDSFSTSIFSLRYCLKGGDYLTITFLPRRDKKRIRGLDFEGFPLILGVYAFLGFYNRNGFIWRVLYPENYPLYKQLRSSYFQLYDVSLFFPDLSPHPLWLQ